MKKITITEKQLNKVIKESIDKVLFKKPNGNFLSECYSDVTGNNGSLVSLNEINAKSLIERHTKDGYAIISPCRGFADFGLNPQKESDKEKLSSINKNRIKEFIEILKVSDFSYTPAYGGFIENLGLEDEESVYERSFIVFNHYKDGSVGDFRKLYDFALRMANKYNQDSVLIKAPNDVPKYITKNGGVDYEFSDDVTFNDLAQEYFTDLHKNTHKFGDISDKKPTRFTFLESYINPAPQCYGERFIRRKKNGEITLSK